MKNREQKNINEKIEKKKIPYDDTPINRKGEIIKFPKIFPNEYRDNNLDHEIKLYKKNLSKKKSLKESEQNKELLKTDDKKELSNIKTKNMTVYCSIK